MTQRAHRQGMRGCPHEFRFSHYEWGEASTTAIPDKVAVAVCGMCGKIVKCVPTFVSSLSAPDESEGEKK